MAAESEKDELAALTTHLRRLEDKLDARNTSDADLAAQVEELKEKIAAVEGKINPKPKGGADGEEPEDDGEFNLF